MSKKKYSLKKPTVRNYPTITAIYGRSKNNSANPNFTTTSMVRQKKKRFGIFTKSEEWKNEYKYQWY